MQIELGIAMAIGSFAIGYFTFRRNKEKDVENTAKESVEVNVKLNHIIKGVDDVKLDLKSNERQINQLSEQVIRVDESAKSAHKRLDRMEEK